MRKAGFEDVADYSHLMDHPSYNPAAEVAAQLMQSYEDGEIDHVELIYHHFKSTATQVLTQETFLPITLVQEEVDKTKAGPALDYIIEPDVETLMLNLIPKALHLKLYTALLDSLASEHAARVVAMQVATDNADDLLHDLTLQYNKSRQQAITAELLDIVGGAQQ